MREDSSTTRSSDDSAGRVWSLSVVDEARGERARAVCPYCGVGCVLDATVEGNRVTRISADTSVEPNRGMMCPKGALLTRVYDDPQRITTPMLRRHRSGPMVPVSWRDAIDFIASNINKTLTTRGPDALAWYGSGQLDTEASYVFTKLFKGFLGCNHTDTNSRLCMSSAVAGYVQSFGSDGPPGCYDDIELADTFFLLGANMAVNHPVLFNRVRRRRATEDQSRIIVIDPRRTKTADHGDLHLAVKPGGDVALVQWITRRLLVSGAIDTTEIEGRVADAPAYVDHLKGLDESVLRSLCGVDEALIEQAVSMMRPARRTLSMYCMGANQSTVGTDKNTAIIGLHVLLGQVGVPGCGPFSLTGQPNAMGGREVGYLSHQLPGYRMVEDALHREEVERAWSLRPGSIAPAAGRSAVPMFEHAAAGGTDVMWIACTNPVVSLPDAHVAERALERTGLVVVQDITVRIETTRFADVLLPACQWGEKVGTMTNSERLVVRSERFIDPPADARPDWWPPAQVARALGFQGFDYQRAEDVWNEFRRLTVGRPCEMGGLTNERLALGPAHWPFAAGAREGTKRRYTDGRCHTPDGRTRLLIGSLRGPAECADKQFPLLLTTGRVAAHWHTRTKSGLSPELARQEPDPFVEVHPEDAQVHGLRDGGWCWVESRRGKARAVVRVSRDVGPAVVFSTFHFGESYGGAVTLNRATHSAYDAVSKQPELKACAVRLWMCEHALRRRCRVSTPSRLRVLVVDEDAQRGRTLSEVLRVTGYDVVTAVSGDVYLPNLVADTQPDLVLIDIGSPDRDTLEQLTRMQESTPRPVVMFARDDDEQTIASAVRAGVSAYVVDGLTTSRVKPIIDVAIAHFRQHQAMRVELERALTSLEERKFIDRAKGVLMERRNVNEQEAFAMLRKLSMDRKQRLGVVSRGLLESLGLVVEGLDHPLHEPMKGGPS